MSAASHPALWRRLQQARPLVAWRTEQLDAVARVLQGAQQAWQEAWGLASEQEGVTCLGASAQDLETCWQFAGASGGAAAWIAPGTHWEAALERSLWGSEREPGPLAARVAVACRADWLLRLRAALGIEPAAADAPELPPLGGAWSGLACASFGGAYRVLLDAPLVQRTLRSAAPGLAQPAAPVAGDAALTPVSSALTAVRLPLQARLADCELELASLQDLRLGDVIPLPHRLDAPLLVRDAHDQALFGGYLARQGRRKALELAAAAPRSIERQP